MSRYLRNASHRQFLPLVFIALLLLSAAPATAAPVDVSMSQQQTIAGQDFSFVFSATDGLLLPEAGAGATVLVELTNIDLSAGSAIETLDYDIESLVGGGPITGSDLDSISDADTVGSISGSYAFEIAPADLAQILSDLTFSMSIDLSDHVGFNNRIPPIVSVTLGYESGLTPVPLPPAAWLFGAALGLLGWIRRRAS